MSTKRRPARTPEWVTVTDAAHHASCSVKTIRRLVATGELKATYLTPRAMRVSRTSLEDLLQANATNQWDGGAA